MNLGIHTLPLTGRHTGDTQAGVSMLEGVEGPGAAAEMSAHFLECAFALFEC